VLEQQRRIDALYVANFAGVGLPLGRLAGYAGPPNRKAAEVVTKYIITDLYAKAIQGMPAEAAVKWAYDEIAKVYV